MVLKEIEQELDNIIEEQEMSYIKGQLFKNNFLKQCNVVKNEMIKNNQYTDDYFKQVCLFSLNNIKDSIKNIKQL